MKDVLILSKFAEDKIREGDFEKANQALIKAIKLDPKCPSTYTLLGNVNYLLNKPKNAMRCYLASIHLQINKLKKMQTATFAGILDLKYNKLSKEEQEILPTKFGLIIFNDSTVPSHIAHATIDLRSEELDQLLKECSSLYRQSIQTGKDTKDLINTYNICHEDYIELEQTHYIALGREILIENLKWDSIDNPNVVQLYFTK
ncbi:MAG: tetratricopeptide repeat protein [Clostridium sp.]